MLMQPYKCTKCDFLGIVRLPDRCGVVQAVNIMRDHHDKYQKNCQFHVDNIVVYPPTDDISEDKEPTDAS